MKKYLALILTLFLLACSSKELYNKNAITLAKLDYEQNLSAFEDYNLSYIPDEVNFLQHYFSPFNIKGDELSKKDALWAITGYRNGKKISYYSASRRQIPDSFFAEIRENAATNSYLKLKQYAITIDNVLLRNAPTFEPIFRDFNLGGEGYPFDYYANSTLSIAYPLFLSHYSKDGAFAFVSNDAVWGWVDSRKIKILSRQEAKNLESSKFFTVLKDRSPVQDLEGKFLFEARIGAILPYNYYENGYFIGEIDSLLGKRAFRIKEGEAFTTWPAEFNQENVKKLLQSLLGEPYGWGGFAFYRDCSLFLKDYFATFGIWLPRNSLSQSKIGKKFDLKNMDNKKKKAFIIENAKPYETILYMPGHVMLYIGHKKNDIIVLHDAWGIRTKDKQRILISSIAITSAEIGKNLKNVAKEALLLSKVSSMNIVSEN